MTSRRRPSTNDTIPGYVSRLIASDLAAGGLDARDGVAGVFDHGRHVMRVGVNDGVGIARDRDMAFPEDQVAALQSPGFRRVQHPAEAVVLHVAVARAAGAGGVQRYLHQAGAIDAKTALAAPQIGRADKTLGDRDEILRHRIDAADMLPRQIPAFARHGEGAVFAHHRQRCPHHQRIDRRQFDRRTGKGKRPDGRDLVRRRGARLCQRAIGQPADIAVAVELAPRKAFAVAVVDGDALALQRLRRELGLGGGPVAQRRDRFRYFEFLAGDKARRLDLAFEIFCGEVAACRRQARIIHSVRSAVCRSRARPGIRRPRGAPVWPMASSRRCRHAASSSRPRRNAAGTARR